MIHESSNMVAGSWILDDFGTFWHGHFGAWLSGTVLTGTVKSYSAKGFGFILCPCLRITGNAGKHE